MTLREGNTKQGDADELYLLVRGDEIIVHYDARIREYIRQDGVADLVRRYWGDDAGVDKVIWISQIDPYRQARVL